MGKDRMPGSNKMLSQKGRWLLVIIGVILIIANLFMVDYDQLWSRENLNQGLQILVNIFVVAMMVVSMRGTAKKKGGEFF